MDKWLKMGSLFLSLFLLCSCNMPAQQVITSPMATTAQPTATTTTTATATESPTEEPTAVVTATPNPTLAPTPTPTQAPTIKPTTQAPTKKPTPTPTQKPTLTPTKTPKPTMQWTEGSLKGLVIGIDPGHQGKGNSEQEPIGPGATTTRKKVSSGTQGKWSRVPEYKVVLEVGLQLKALLEEAGATVIMSRETHNVNISNAERAKMMNEAISAAIAGPAFASPWFAFGIMLFTRSLCTKGAVGAPEEKKIRRDLRMCIWAKTPIFALMAVSYTVFYVRYASQLAWWILGVTIVTDGIFLWMLCIALRRIYRVNRHKWELCPTHVVEKTVSVHRDIDSDTPRRHYSLMLETKGRTWQKNVNDREHSRTRYDSALWAVCMEGKERPMILYNVNGDATW